MSYFEKQSDGTVNYLVLGDVVATLDRGLWHWTDGRMLSQPAQNIYNKSLRDDTDDGNVRTAA